MRFKVVTFRNTRRRLNRCVIDDGIIQPEKVKHQRNQRTTTSVQRAWLIFISIESLVAPRTPTVSTLCFFSYQTVLLGHRRPAHGVPVPMLDLRYIRGLWSQNIALETIHGNTVRVDDATP